MATTLQRPPAPLPATRFSVEEYRRWSETGDSDRRTELIRGFILPKPVPSPPHNLVVRRLFWLAHAAKGPGELVRKEEALTLADSEPEPDVAVVAGEEDDFGHVHPSTARLTIEVCLNSEPRDRDKLELYAEAGIPEYWIVFPEDGLIEVHTVPRASRYTHVETFGAGETVVSAAVPSLRVTVDELFCV